MLDPRKILEFPPVYNAFQKIVGGERNRRRFITECVTPLARGGRMLEIGCGPGTNIEYLPADVEYVGCDIQPNYIAYAQKQYGHRGKFYLTPVGKLSELPREPFDVITAVAVLHHLDDAQIATLCDEVLALLKPTGSFITIDPCFTNEQSRLERFITACDRGKFVRFPEQIHAILSQKFRQVQEKIEKVDAMLIPCTGVTMIASNG